MKGTRRFHTISTYRGRRSGDGLAKEVVEICDLVVKD